MPCPSPSFRRGGATGCLIASGRQASGLHGEREASYDGCIPTYCWSRWPPRVQRSAWSAIIECTKQSPAQARLAVSSSFDICPLAGRTCTAATSNRTTFGHRAVSVQGINDCVGATGQRLVRWQVNGRSRPFSTTEREFWAWSGFGYGTACSPIGLVTYFIARPNQALCTYLLLRIDI